MLKAVTYSFVALSLSSQTWALDPNKIPFIDSSAKIDGVLEADIWQRALEIDINNITWPYENQSSPVQTKAYVYENGQSLFIAFDAKDPNPELIRAFYRDRDRAWEDDLVGIKIDSFNNAQSAYQFFINPLGVQQDSIENELTKSENGSWNGIWDSVGKINKDGYVVEVEIPLRVLNFNDSLESKTMALEFLRFYPRNERLRISSMQLQHANSCWICQMPKYQGFAKAKQGSNFAVIPTLVTNRQESRDINDGIAEPWQADNNVEPGLDVKWAITPDTTLNATLNPDFSQVEADTGQLSVNNSFSLFFPEKRAFFLDNSDYFSSHLNLIHTRNISAPDYGVKLTGNKNGHTFAGFIANDERLNVVVPGNLGSSVVSLERNSQNMALRYRHDLNKTLSVGVTSTTRQSDDYRNQVASIDAKYKPTDNDTLQVQLIGSDTDYDSAFVESLCDSTLAECDLNESVLRVIDEDDRGAGYYVNYEHNRKHWKAFTSYQARDAALRTDMGFITQVDFNKFLFGGEYRWYGDDNNWWNRARWYADWDISHNEQGELLEKEVQTNFAVDGPLQSFLDFGVEHRKRTGLRHDETRLAIDGNTDLFTENSQWTYMEFKPMAGVFAGLNLSKGNRVDLANNRLGDLYFARPVINVNLGKHFEVRLRHTFEKMKANGAKVYTANLSDIRLTYQFNINSYLRLAIINTDISRNQSNYNDDVDATYKSISTQLLYSYKLNPQTVFFAGYSDHGYQDDDLSKITKDEKTVFMKFSYAWLI
ncbi:carbohydrate binding family 9 domain-containing protein [Pseudoalteromonas sp. NJ631]|uniref:carbohydrate binding family 9 domain-containing protein n=1 Tax=Pseudoalteromonas sp. NJ631 TaxID=493915 RepID=UPI0002DC938B|nr:carbohydrate binding family 9 domain-containing protein [Pseudoalteromonas sp. NJ631]